MILYKDVLEKGFAFSEINLNPIAKDLESLEFYENEDRKPGVEVSWSTFGMPKKVNDYLIHSLKNVCDDYIGSLIDKIDTFEAYKTEVKEYTQLHSDSSFGGLIQIMVYYIKGDLKGRNFLYGKVNRIDSIIPYTGLVIVSDQLNKEWLHGTKPLINPCFNLCITAITPR